MIEGEPGLFVRSCDDFDLFRLLRASEFTGMQAHCLAGCKASARGAATNVVAEAAAFPPDRINCRVGPNRCRHNAWAQTLTQACSHSELAFSHLV